MAVRFRATSQGRRLLLGFRLGPEHHSDLRTLNNHRHDFSILAVQVLCESITERAIGVARQELALGDLASEVAHTTTAGLSRPEAPLVSVPKFWKGRSNVAAFISKMSDTGVPASVAP